MVILFGASGQLCNRLFNISAFVANSRDLNYKLICTGFEEYYELFESIDEVVRPFNIQILEPKQTYKKKILQTERKILSKFRLLNKLSNIELYNKTGNLNDSNFLQIAKIKRCYVIGWPYWDVDRFIKYTPYIKSIFQPKKEFVIEVLNKIKFWKSEYTVIVGVHVRRGDYKTYMDGKYFFDDFVYKNRIIEINNQLKEDGRNPIFIICSNENINFEEKFKIPYFISNYDAIRDLILLSHCDYIFGPPSTFSMWASFYGNVPSTWISSDISIYLKDFSPVIAPNIYANGKHIID